MDAEYYKLDDLKADRLVEAVHVALTRTSVTRGRLCHVFVGPTFSKIRWGRACRNRLARGLYKRVMLAESSETGTRQTQTTICINE